MVSFEEKLHSIIQEIKRFFHKNFLSLHIFDLDGLPIESSKGHLYKEEEVGPFTVSLLFSIDRFVELISKEEPHTTILTTPGYKFILSQIKDLRIIVLLVLLNDKESPFLEYGVCTSQQIENLMKSLTATDSMIFEEDTFLLEPLS